MSRSVRSAKGESKNVLKSKDKYADGLVEKLWKEVLNLGCFTYPNGEKYHFERNVKIEAVEVDFVCYEVPLVLEIVTTGKYLTGDEKEKEHALGELGYELIRITGDEINDNTEGLKFYLRKCIEEYEEHEEKHKRNPGDTLTKYLEEGGLL